MTNGQDSTSEEPTARVKEPWCSEAVELDESGILTVGGSGTRGFPAAAVVAAFAGAGAGTGAAGSGAVRWRRPLTIWYADGVQAKSHGWWQKAEVG